MTPPTENNSGKQARNCPTCNRELEPVTYPGGSLNRDQWESVRAGDWYCENCHDPKDPMRHRYFWERDFKDAMTLENNSQQGAKYRIVEIGERFHIAKTDGASIAKCWDKADAQQIIDDLNEREALLGCLRKIASDEKEFCYHADLAKSVLTRQPK